MQASAYDPTADLRRIAREQFGIPGPFPWQEDAMKALVRPMSRVLAVAPTGGGKSLCYQLPACLLEGTALVVSPLISLMEDQVRSLENRGIPATYLASTLSSEERQARFSGIRRGRYRLVYVAPERLSESIYDIVPMHQLSLLAIDEAHCIVHWGQDFRPDYLRLGEVIQRMPPPRLLACTATATPATRAEILRALGLDEGRVSLVLKGFARPNLALSVEHVSGPREALSRADEALRLTLVDPKSPRGAGIIYAATRRQTESVSEHLNAMGWRSHPYHAGLDGELRARVSRAFADRHLDIVVATNAFGMGIDRSDVRVVVHTQPPASIESYYQEVGRAGRDGRPAGGLLCLSPADIPLRRRLIENGLDGQPADKNMVQRQWGLFRDLLRYVDACSCRHDFILRYFGDEAEAIGGCGRCDVCRARAAEDREDPSAGERDSLVTRKVLAGVARAARRGGMSAICDMLRGIKGERLVRFGFDQLTTFGVLSDMNHDEVTAALRATVAAGYVDVTTGDFPVPYLTELGARVMKAEIPSVIRLRPIEPRPGKVRVKKARSRAEPSAGPAQPPSHEARRRYDALRELRTRLARDASVPPYVIAPDAALLAAAERNPKTLTELADVHGWGATRVARFGQAILEVLRLPGLRGPHPLVAAGAGRGFHGAMQSQLKRKLVFGGVAALCLGGSAGHLASLPEWTPTALAPLAGPAAFLFVLWLGAPHIFALPTLQEAISAHSLADGARASQLLDELERSIWRGRMAPNIAYLRALLSFQLGDLAASKQFLDRAMDQPLGLFTRPERQVIRASARSLRALVAALQGDAAQAEEDIRGAESDPDGMADAPATAAMARGFLLLKQGRVAEARAHIASHRRLLTMATQGDVRALARALLRPWSIPEASVYRAQGNEADPPTSSTAAWLLKVAPSLRDLLAPRGEDEPQGVAASPAAPSRAPKLETQALPRPLVGTARRVLVLWVALVLCSVFLWQFLGTPQGPARAHTGGERGGPGDLFPVLIPAFFALLAFVYARALKRSKTTQQTLNQGDIALARGDDEAAAQIFRRMIADQTSALNRGIGAQRMASLANLHGDHSEALRWCDEARKQLDSVRVVGVLADQMVVNEKTLALAMQDRVGEARAEIDALEKRAPESLYLPSMRFTLELLEAVRAGDLARAGAIARGRSGGLMLGAHVELLAEAAQLGSDESASRSQLSGLLHELAQDERIGAWLQRVAPALIDRIRTRAASAA